MLNAKLNLKINKEKKKKKSIFKMKDYFNDNLNH